MLRDRVQPVCLNILIALWKEKPPQELALESAEDISCVPAAGQRLHSIDIQSGKTKHRHPNHPKQYDMKQTLPSNLPQPSLLPFPKPTSAPLPLFQHQLDHHPRPLQRILLAPEPIQSSPAMPRTRSIEPHVRPCLRKLQRQRVQRDFRDGVRYAGGGREGAGGDGVERGAGRGDVHNAGRGGFLEERDGEGG